MKKHVVKLCAVITLLALCGLSCGGQPPQKQETKLEKMKPKAEDRLNTLMNRSWDNLEYLFYGFINYDLEKIKRATDNLIILSDYTAERISPAHRSHVVEWKEQCNVQRELVVKIRDEFENQNFEGAREHFVKLLGICMDCHKLYRKHLIKQE